MLIVYVGATIGWEPITYMIHLAAELFEAELLTIDRQKPSFFEQLEAAFLSWQKRQGHESCLLICPNPSDLMYLLLIKNWRKQFRYIAAWIIDSFWLDWIPKVVEFSRLFDHLFVTTEEDIPEWNRIMRTPTTWLPWGADVFRLGGKDTERMWDLTRIGRQPPEWDNDSTTQQLCVNSNLRFHGRLQVFDSATKTQRMLTQLYRQTKFLLAFSNAVNPTAYTHPTRQYLTARWTDALACGAIVAGIPPKEPSIERLLWDGAILNLGSVRIEDGLQVIADAVKSWSAEDAKKNHEYALKRLDWRWRFEVIADVLNESPMRLHHELQLLKQQT
jgi:hypothetical protein